MRCEEIMTRNPVCVMPHETVDHAAQIMQREDVGSLPVVDGEHSQHLVGIVTDRDLAMRVVAEGREPRSTPVEQAMSRDVVTVHTEDDIRKALDKMAEHQLRRIPVVDHQEKVVGIIAQADVAMRLQKDSKTAEVVKDISEPDGPDR
jgi:CBS domain-containing protein